MAGASPGASSTFTSGQVGGWCAGAAAAAAFPCPWHQTHWRRLGESQRWALNAAAHLCQDQRHQETAGVCREGERPGMISSQGVQQRLRKSLPMAHTRCASCGRAPLLSERWVCPSSVRWTFNPDSPLVTDFITAHRSSWNTPFCGILLMWTAADSGGQSVPRA